MAPMKALAAEMADTFGKRLAPFGVRVRECTGDMQLTAQEVKETQVSFEPYYLVFIKTLILSVYQFLIIISESIEGLGHLRFLLIREIVLWG